MPLTQIHLQKPEIGQFLIAQIGCCINANQTNPSK